MARNGGGGIQHLAHTRAAFGSFVADDHHIAFHDLSACDGRDGVLLAVKDAGRSLMHHHLRHYGRALHHSRIRSQVALQDGDSADLAVGIIDRDG